MVILLKGSFEFPKTVAHAYLKHLTVTPLAGVLRNLWVVPELGEV